MSENPLVTVNILSFNRKDELRTTLTKVFKQNYKNIEVIVVDNASTDGTVEMIEKDFPQVHFIRLEKNLGIAGWNRGFEVAKGDYVLVLDDDSYPVENAIQKAIECMNTDNKIGVVCLKIYNGTEKRFETDHIDKIKPNTFIGCGALIRTSIFKDTGYFSELFFLYEHETEFSMRVYNSGFIIKYCDVALVIHDSSHLNRIIKNQSDLRRKYFMCRNYVLILFLHFDLFRIIIFLPQLIFGRLIVSVLERNFFTATKGFIKAFIQIPTVIKVRNLLKNEIQKFYGYGNYMGRFVRDKRY